MHNSKGVLLCHRPESFSNTQAKRKAIRARCFHPSFTQEVTHPCGRNPAVVERKRFIPPSLPVKSWDAKLYLAQLVEKQKHLREAAEEAKARADKRRARLCVESRVLQELIRHGAGGIDGLTWNEAKVVAKICGQQALPITDQEEGRPAWARSEEEQLAREDAECSSILDFAQTLDADTYLNDLEVGPSVLHSL